MTSIQRKLIVLFSLLTFILGACSSTSSKEDLVVPRGEFYATEAHLVEAVSLGTISAGLLNREPYSKYIDAETFRSAIEESLRNNGYLSTSDSGRYVLDVDFINLAVLGVFRLTGTCMIEYALTDTVTQAEKFREQIESRHVESFKGGSGHARSMRAREAALQENIRELISKLSLIEEIE